MVDLFAGIGGFSYAAHQFGFKTDVFVEMDNFCQKVLNKNFPSVPIVDDIFNFNIELYEKLTNKTTTDIISGGFPCQPFSSAGSRKGENDNRHLWPQMYRVIKELKPRWVIAENVHGIIHISNGLVFETVHSNLEDEGYDVQSFIIPAVAKNALHRRDRVWIVANSYKVGFEAFNNCWEKRHIPTEFKGSNGEKQRQGIQGIIESRTPRPIGTVENERGQSKNELHKNKATESPLQQSRFDYFREFPTESPICRGNDGIPDRMDRIAALGNAIVPQVAMEIFRIIKELELTTYQKEQ